MQYWAELLHVLGHILYVCGVASATVCIFAGGCSTTPIGLASVATLGLGYPEWLGEMWSVERIINQLTGFMNNEYYIIPLGRLAVGK